MEILNFNRSNFCLQAAKCGQGQVAIILGSHKYYSRTFSDNLKAKLQLVFIDTRAFVATSSSHKQEDFTQDKILEDIEFIINALDLDKVILIGHSIHTFMALEYANKYPDKISHLVLIASSPITGPELYKEADRYFEESVCPDRKKAVATAMQNFIQCDNKSLINRMLAFGPRLWYDYNFDATNLWKGVNINAIGQEIIWGSMFENYPIADKLSNIKVPIFLALGRYDYFNPPPLWEKYRELSSDFTIRIFEKSGHTPQLEESENFDSELLQWLNSKKNSDRNFNLESYTIESTETDFGTLAADFDFLTQKINEEKPDFGKAYPFAFLIKNDKKQIIGGCNGFVIFGNIYTDQLWVDPNYRNNGLGYKLMAKVHEYGVKSGCTMATLATMNFQEVLSFYAKLGYITDFERTGYNKGASCIFMRKEL
jgi:proline iminopeptidase